MASLTPQQTQASNAALACCGVALLALIPPALHQLGLLDHLPDPPSPLFDSDAITGSKAAHPLGIPDSLLGLASFSATFALLAAARHSTLARKLLPLKLNADAAAASLNAGRQILQFHRLCSWCTATALATAATVHFGRKSLRESRCADPLFHFSETP